MKINYQIDDFMEHCVEKGLSRKTISSYEQTLILFANYVKSKHGIKARGEALLQRDLPSYKMVIW